MFSTGYLNAGQPESTGVHPDEMSGGGEAWSGLTPPDAMRGREQDSGLMIAAGESARHGHKTTAMCSRRPSRRPNERRERPALAREGVKGVAAEGFTAASR